MASYQQKKSGWFVQVRRKGHDSISRTFNTKAEGERWALQIEASMGVGTYVDNRETLTTSLSECFDRYAASWALDFERRAADILQKSIDKIKQPENGKDGCNGIDGKDGLGFDDLSVVQLTDKRLKFVFESGERKKEFVIDMPIVIDCGVFGDGKEYKKGDGVTYGGSFWIAQKDNPNQRPGGGSEWRLAVKCGKDGKDTY